MTGTGAFFKYRQDHDFEGRMVLNIGCGFEQFLAPNVVNMDLYDICEPDIVWDLNKTPLPFPDNHFDFILANHILEHVEKFWELFVDCARMLKPNGIMEVWVPGDGSDSVFGYRDHVHQINPCSFFGTFGNYRHGGNAYAEHVSRSHANRMKFISAAYRAKDIWWIRYAPKWLQHWFRLHLRNVIEEQQFIFRKVTDAEWEAEEERLKDRTELIYENKKNRIMEFRKKVV